MHWSDFFSQNSINMTSKKFKQTWYIHAIFQPSKVSKNLLRDDPQSKQIPVYQNNRKILTFGMFIFNPTWVRSLWLSKVRVYTAFPTSSSSCLPQISWESTNSYLKPALAPQQKNAAEGKEKCLLPFDDFSSPTLSIRKTRN